MDKTKWIKHIKIYNSTDIVKLFDATLYKLNTIVKTI